MGGVALLGVFIMLVGYNWHDAMDTHSNVEEYNCGEILTIPWAHSFGDVESCKSYQMSFYVSIFGWALMIIGMIGYFGLSARSKLLKKSTSSGQPKTKVLKSTKVKAGVPKPQVFAGRVILLCPECGAKNDEDSEFCKKCGKRLRPKR